MSKTVVCPIDERFATEISALLQSPPPHQVQEYYEKLLQSRKCNGFKVKQDSHFGKGVYAEANYKEGDLLLRDQMLFGTQHSSNKLECLVCSFCFCFIGSIELQIGRRLFFQQLGLSPHHGCHEITDSFNSEELPRNKSYGGLNGCTSSSNGEIVPLPEEIVNSLMNGEMKLPRREKFPFPPVVSCHGGCKEAYYCSKSCADADWDASHSLLCTGERSKVSSKLALLKFIQHANETNDIFLLAAKAISYTILRYRNLKATCGSRQPKHASPHSTESFDLSLLMEAWKPIAMGHKKRWWECIALPEDVDNAEEFAFRKQIKELAFSSLQLLKPAIFDSECEPLFSLEIYGHIIGMFELNNLDLVVASPLEDYFLYIDDLPSPQKEEAERDTQPILDSLGEDYGICCEGTAFYPLQSCMNHSCCPSAKAFKREEDRDGPATIIALRTICKGEEITISYIDEDLPFQERQALLADYGFKCSCLKCQEESNS